MRPRSLTLLLGAVALLALPARAELPLPTYPECGEEDAVALCPNDLSEDWSLLSYVPAASRDSVREAELSLGSGISADRAWRESTGRFDVTIAVGDSGVLWDERNIVNKIRLNAAELPWPMSGDGEEVEGGDVNGDGLYNIADWADDARVSASAGDDRADGLLDPSDLIATFSDGLDDDGNGYVDDIAGWDFYENDNNPFSTYDDGYGTHGTGVMEEGAAEGGDGGAIGVCPNCAILPIRLGETFITDGTRIAQGVAYAADMGADVMGMAIGALSSPAEIPQALEYARRAGVFIIAAAGDENAYHRNYPGVFGDVLFVHSIRSDTGGEEGGVYSYMNFFNCNNYGPRLDVVAPSEGCATGSVSKIIGVAGLLQSAALDVGLTLTPEELRQLVLLNVDDVWLTDDELSEARTYPSREGWDPYYGHGRVNTELAVQEVINGRIPPTARFVSPEWFEFNQGGGGGELSFVVEADAPRADSFTWTLEWGRGLDPQSWTPLASGEATAALNTAVALPIASLDRVDTPEGDIDETMLARVERVHGPLVTARLTVVDEDGLVAEARRSVWVIHDDALLPGFPKALGASGEPSPALVDFDGDGVLEIVVASSSGVVSVLNGAGENLPGFPVATGADPRFVAPDAPAYATGALPTPTEGVLASPGVADLDGDGGVDVVVAGLSGSIYAWDETGALRPGFPARILGRAPSELSRTFLWDTGVAGAPTLVDLDGDGAREIIFAAFDGRLYVLDKDGAAVAPYPIEVCHPENCGKSGARSINSVTVGDLDGDGDQDLILGNNETVRDGRDSVTFAYDAKTGELLPGWPIQDSGLVAVAALLPIIGEGHPATPAIFDLDGDDDMELLDPIMIGQTGVKDHQGEEVLPLTYLGDEYGAQTNTDEPSFVALSNNPAVGDLDGDGVKDLVLGGSGSYALVGLALTTAVEFQHVIAAWSGATGEFLPGFPRQIEDFQFLVAPAIADVSGDGRPEVIYASAGSLVHAWDADGVEAPGFPKNTGQWLLGSPAVGDIDGDGYVEVVVTTREGQLFAWRTQGRADQEIQWASLHHDAANTSNTRTVIPRQLGPEELAEGCGCRDGGEKAALWLSPLLLAGVLGARRRRA